MTCCPYVRPTNNPRHKRRWSGKYMPTVVTTTVGPSKDYTSLAAAEAGEQADLVSADVQLDIECYSFEDTTAVVIDGWTTDATRYIRVYTPTAERHDGKWNTGKYRLVVSSTAVPVITFSENYVRFEGLQVHNTSSDRAQGIAPGAVAFASGANLVKISHSIVRGTNCSASATSSIGIGAADNAFDNLIWHIYNNIVYDWTMTAGSGGEGRGISAAGFAQDAEVENNTAHSCDVGIRRGGTGTAHAYNNLAQSCGTDFSGTWSGGTHNASEDGTHPGTDGQTGTATFVDAASDDFHLDAADTVALDNGTDRSAGAIAFTTDIDGETRSGSWDIGADEYPSSVVVVGCGLLQSTKLSRLSLVG